MSFPKAKITRFNEESSCAPPPGTYNTEGTVFKTVLKRTPIKRKLEESSAGHLSQSTPSKQQAVRSYSLPVFRTPSVKKGMKNRSFSQNLVICKEKEDNTNFSVAASDDDDKQNNLCQTNIQDLQSSCSQCSHNFTSEEVMEFLRNISDLKYKLMISQTIEDDLRKELEQKNNYGQNYLCVTQENIELTEKLKKERDDHQACVCSLGNQIQKALSEKEDLKAAIDAMKSAFIIINDEYLSLEKNFNCLKKEKLILINEIIELKIAATNTSLYNVDIKCMSCGFIYKYDIAAANLESIIHEISTFFKQMENEFYSLKTQYNKYMENTINLLFHSFTEEIESMEHQISKGLTQLNEYAAITNLTLEEFLEEYNKICDRLIKSECERIDSQICCDTNQALAMEVQNENIELQSIIKRNEVKLNNYKIANNGLHSTVRALSKRLFENGEEIEKLNLVIETSKIDKISVQNITTKFLSEDMFKLLDCTANMQKELNNCLSHIKNILASIQPNPSNKTDDSSVLNTLLPKLVKLLNISTTANDIFAYIQMESNSLKLQLNDMAENLKKAEDQKAQKDIKLAEYAQKLNDQAEVIEQQSKSIGSMQVLLNHQHEYMKQMHLLQMQLEDEANVVSLEEKLADKNKEFYDLRHAYEDLLNQHTILVENNKMFNVDQNIGMSKQEDDLKLYVQKLEQKLKRLDQCLKQEKERNYSLEAEIKILNKTICQCNNDKENDHKYSCKNNVRTEDYLPSKKKKRTYGSPNSRTFNNSKKFSSTSPKVTQSPVLKDRNII